MGLNDVLTAAANEIGWDGNPVNVPDSDLRLYSDIPEAKLPTGWCALLISAAEIFTFYWPTKRGEPNCRPTLQALRRAAEVEKSHCMNTTVKKVYGLNQK